LVCYMASAHLENLVNRLLEFGCSPQKPLAVIEQGTTVYQQVHITSLENFVTDFAGKTFSSPSLVVIGDIVKLHEQFCWFEGKEVGSVFGELIRTIK
jgi:siroheme synthase